MQDDVLLGDNNIYCYHISYYTSYTTKYDADISRLVCPDVCVCVCANLFLTFTNSCHSNVSNILQKLPDGLALSSRIHR